MHWFFLTLGTQTCSCLTTNTYTDWFFLSKHTHTLVTVGIIGLRILMPSLVAGENGIQTLGIMACIRSLVAPYLVVVHMPLCVCTCLYASYWPYKMYMCHVCVITFLMSKSTCHVCAVKCAFWRCESVTPFAHVSLVNIHLSHVRDSAILTTRIMSSTKNDTRMHTYIHTYNTYIHEHGVQSVIYICQHIVNDVFTPESWKERSSAFLMTPTPWMTTLGLMRTRATTTLGLMRKPVMRRHGDNQRASFVWLRLGGVVHRTCHGEPRAPIVAISVRVYVCVGQRGCERMSVWPHILMSVD